MDFSFHFLNHPLLYFLCNLIPAVECNMVLHIIICEAENLFETNTESEIVDCSFEKSSYILLYCGYWWMLKLLFFVREFISTLNNEIKQNFLSLCHVQEVIYLPTIQPIP